MPTQTFFNLSDEKRMILTNAAKKEFSRVPLYKASIANIIKDAAIARGSFYQYFEDIEDLFFYLLQIDAETRRKEFQQAIDANNGDLFVTLIITFKSMLKDFDNESVRKFYQNVFLNMNYKMEKTFLSNKMDEEFNQYMAFMREHIDTSCLNIREENDLAHIIQISSSVMIQNIIYKFAMNLSNEAIINNYMHQLTLLRRGFEKAE